MGEMQNVFDKLFAQPSKVVGVLAISGCYWKGKDIWDGFKQTFTVSSTLTGTTSMGAAINTSTEDYYFELLKFIGKNYLSKSPISTLHIDYPKEFDNYEPEVCRIPGHSSHNFWFKGCWFHLDRSISETLTISTFKWNQPVLDELLETILKDAQKHRKDRTAIFYSDKENWKHMGSKYKRPLESVVIKAGLKDQLLSDIREFLNSKEWYKKRGIPYHRGYLLHGPPGTGKTSLITAIAGAIEHDISLVSLSSDGITDDELNLSMNTVYHKSIVLLEDIDAAFPSRETGSTADDSILLHEEERKNHSKVTFKGLLNALDGVASKEGRIIFMTTNHVKRLDPTLIRPGRVDLKLLIDYPTEAQIIEMFNQFYKGLCEDLEKYSRDFAKTVLGMDEKSSMASIQNLFIIYKDNPEKCIANAEEYLKEWTITNKKTHLDIYC